MNFRIAAIPFAFAFLAQADVTSEPRAYPAGFSIVIKLAGDLYAALPPGYEGKLDAQTVALEPQDLPVVAPIASSDDNRVLCQVCLSAGFIDVVNHICHAKAIDRVQPGYFDHYIKNMAQLSVSNSVAQAPNIVDPRFWTLDIMNEQASYFDEVIGMLTAINLSHHYLGHYAKYAGKLSGPSDVVTPINNFLSQDEWDVSVKAGAVDALNCALCTDGARILFEAIDRMPHRPSWAAYIVPQQVDIKKLNKQLVAYETEFFHGRLK